MFIKSDVKDALVLDNKKVSYTELLQHIEYYYSLIKDKNYNKIVIISENRFEWAYAFYSIWKKNAIAVPIDAQSKSEEVAYILNDCNPELIYTSNELRPNVDEALKLIDYKPDILIVDELKEDASKFKAEDFNSRNDDETCLIIYTSGTTGNPKGVMLSYKNLMMNIRAVTSEINIYNAERNTLQLLPLHHILPLLGTMVMPLYAHATVGISKSMIAADIMKAMQDNQTQIMVGVPRLYEAFMKGIKDVINKSIITRSIFALARIVNSRSFSRKIFKKVHDRFGGKMRYMVCGGAKLKEDLGNDYKTLGFEMLEGFGMTEAAPMITFTRPDRWVIGSAGEPLPGATIDVKDGELIVKGDNIMKGYYNKPEETAEIIKEGWLYTGDLGYVKDNYIYITGRKKEIIVLSNGKNINPEEIEAKIIANPFVKEAAAFAQNETLNLVVVPDFAALREEGVVNIEEKIKWDVVDKYNNGAAAYKKISKFYIHKDELPRTRLGKIKRFQIADLIEKDSKQKTLKDEPEFQEYKLIKDYLKEQKNSEIFPDDHIELDLALDSLDKVNLQVFLESSFGIEMDETVFAHHPTVEKLSHFIKEKKNKISIETVKWKEIFKEKVDLKLPKSWFTHNLLKQFSKFFLNIYFRLRTEGKDNLPDPPFIIAPNHQSFFDGLFVSINLKRKLFKNTYFYAKEKHIRNPFVKAFANRNNVIGMDINKDLKKSLQKLGEVLRKKKNIIIFPEGTRSKTGSLGEFKRFFAILSAEFNVPIVPVIIDGANKALPKGSLLPRPFKKIRIKFLKPVYPNNDDYETISDKVFNEINAELSNNSKES